MDNIEFKKHLHNLKKIHVDIENQMLRFDEVIPYERQGSFEIDSSKQIMTDKKIQTHEYDRPKTSEIYSPRLLNLMLACGPQVEAVTRLIFTKYEFKNDDHNSIPNLIKKINDKNVLSNFSIFSERHNIFFKPFTPKLSWWNMYNKIKHDLATMQFELTYDAVMNAFAALTGLHCLANKISSRDNQQIREVLDSKYWSSDAGHIRLHDRHI